MWPLCALVWMLCWQGCAQLCSQLCSQLSSQGCTQLCTAPQKALYISYNSLSKRDTLTSMFRQINTKIDKYSDIYIDASTANSYSLADLLPQLYYNEHHQQQLYHDSEKVRVNLGDVTLGFHTSYEISYKNGSKSIGTARGHVLLDQHSYFIKKLVKVGDRLEWELEELTKLFLSYPLSIEESEPALKSADKSNLESLLNGHEGSQKLPTAIMAAFNSRYASTLKDHLNSEDIINTSSISYQFKGIKFDFTNRVKNFTLTNSSAKGLEIFLLFQLDGHTQQCGPDKISFNQADYGGLQEVYSISVMRQMFKYAVSSGLYAAKIDRLWEVPSFQFYMGDLSNVIPEASRYLPDSPFFGSCEWDSANSAPLGFGAYSDTELYSQVPLQCKFFHNSNTFLRINFVLVIVARIIPQQDSLKLVISSANAVNIKNEILEPTFSMPDAKIERYYMEEVLKGLIGREVLGSGWKTASRRFPSVHLPNNDFMILHDPSEI